MTQTQTQTKTFVIKADEQLLKSFKQACSDNDRPASQVMRELMRDYIKKNRQGNLPL